jgi:predicted metalloendopeptidase
MQDMYEYACGGWETNARMPESRSSWGIVQEMAARAAKEQTRIVAMFSHQPSQVIVTVVTSV